MHTSAEHVGTRAGGLPPPSLAAGALAPAPPLLLFQLWSPHLCGTEQLKYFCWTPHPLWHSRAENPGLLTPRSVLQPLLVGQSKGLGGSWGTHKVFSLPCGQGRFRDQLFYRQKEASSA